MTCWLQPASENNEERLHNMKNRRVDNMRLAAFLTEWADVPL